MHLPDRLNIPHDALVLEIGGGGGPHPRTSVLVDKYPGSDGTRQRGGVALVVGSRTLIQADGSRLPFRDGQFDYVIASHVIEHVPAPDVFGFIQELQRVATRGYLEAPSIVYETLRDIPEHLWLVHLAEGTVHLTPRPEAEPWTRLTDPLFDDAGFRAVIERLADLFFVGMEWEKSLCIETHATLEELVAVVPNAWATEAIGVGNDRARTRELERSGLGRLTAAALPPFVTQRLRGGLHRLSGPAPRAQKPAEVAPRIVEWRELVVCPVCHGLLIEETTGQLCCASCQHSFEVSRGDVPCLLVEQGSPA
jgi:uncharacterized protein YbaR (Trm112 family)